MPPGLPPLSRPAADANRKGRYAALQALVPRVGAAPLLALQPGLVGSCLEAMSFHLIASAVTGMLLALLAQLQQEAAGRPGGTAAAAAAAAAAAGSNGGRGNGGAGGGQGGGDWRACWLPPLTAALRDGSEQLRDNVASHLLPRLLAQDPPALGLLLGRLLPGSPAAVPSPTGAAPAAAASAAGGKVPAEGSAAGCLAVLTAARRQQLLPDLHLLPVEGLGAEAVRAALLAAVRSADECLRCVVSPCPVPSPAENMTSVALLPSLPYPP